MFKMSNITVLFFHITYSFTQRKLIILQFLIQVLVINTLHVHYQISLPKPQNHHTLTNTIKKVFIIIQRQRPPLANTTCNYGFLLGRISAYALIISQNQPLQLGPTISYFHNDYYSQHACTVRTFRHTRRHTQAGADCLIAGSHGQQLNHRSVQQI